MLLIIEKLREALTELIAVVVLEAPISYDAKSYGVRLLRFVYPIMYPAYTLQYKRHPTSGCMKLANETIKPLCKGRDGG